MTQVSNATVLSIFAVLQIAGTLLFAWMGVYADKDFFLLLGNVVCAFGAGVWVVMLLEEQGNPTWVTVFLVLGALSLYAVGVLFNKYRTEGIDDSDSDSDAGEEDVADAKGKHAIVAAGAQKDGKKAGAAPGAALRRRKK